MNYETAKIQQVTKGGKGTDMLPCITKRGDKYLARVEIEQDKFVRRTFDSEQAAYNWRLVQQHERAAL